VWFIGLPPALLRLSYRQLLVYRAATQRPLAGWAAWRNDEPHHNTLRLRVPDNRLAVEAFNG